MSGGECKPVSLVLPGRCALLAGQQAQLAWKFRKMRRTLIATSKRRYRGKQFQSALRQGRRLGSAHRDKLEKSPPIRQVSRLLSGSRFGPDVAAHSRMRSLTELRMLRWPAGHARLGMRIRKIPRGKERCRPRMLQYPLDDF